MDSKDTGYIAAIACVFFQASYRNTLLSCLGILHGGIIPYSLTSFEFVWVSAKQTKWKRSDVCLWTEATNDKRHTRLS